MAGLRHKYRAKPTVVGGRRYASKLEARYAEQLKTLQLAGKVIGWLEQVPLHLPGGITYRLDFVVFDADGSVRFVETKGYETPQWRDKIKLAREAYPWIDIEVVKRVR